MRSWRGNYADRLRAKTPPPAPAAVPVLTGSRPLGDPVCAWWLAADSPCCRSAAALAVHLMTNTAITGATFDIDGGQQLVQG
jgi:hypothetical protein